MTSGAIPAAAADRASAGLSRAWSMALRRLGALTLLFAVIFHADLIDLVSAWWRSQPYNHCLFLPIILAWLVWQRRAGLAGLRPVAWAPGLLWLALGTLAWLVGWAAGVALFRHAALVLMGQGLVVAMLGPQVARALTFPLFYALFMIPVGTEAEPFMQILTARMAMVLLGLAAVPASIEGIFIAVPGALFRVAEACSGTGFMIAMAAYTTLAANLCFKSPLRRALFITGALLVCLLANAVRAFGIIYIAYLTSVESAIFVDHVVYGWVFFALVIALVMWVASRWFDRDPRLAWGASDGASTGRAPRGSRPWPVALAALAVMLAPALWSFYGRAMAEPLPPRTAFPAVPGWQLTDAPDPAPWAPHYVGADRLYVGHYQAADGSRVDLAQVLFDDQAEGRELVGFGQGAFAPDGEGHWRWSGPANAPLGAHGEIIVGPARTLRLAWTYYRLDGVTTGTASGVKLATLKARLLAGDRRAMALIVSTSLGEGPQAEADGRARLDRFLRALGPIEQLADRSLGLR